ncbi:membrane protein [Rhizobiales bacterium GAS113]|nr:membrane protein [Rhizobiales bacterium GAS113]
MRSTFKFIYETANRFLAHDGWAIASHIALSALTSLFPFLIVVTALAGFFGSEELAQETAKLMFLAWPKEVADPIAGEVFRVLTERNHGLLTLGTLAAFYFASSGVESLRIGLNRAYGGVEKRPWYWLRFQSILYILAGAAVMLVFAFLVVLGPLIWSIVLRYVPTLEPFTREVTLLSYAVTGVAATGALVGAHRLLPAQPQPLHRLAPGIILTLTLWLAGGFGFGAYLRSFAGNYVTTYAGLATVMIALVFLYTMAAIFLLGGEVNAMLAELVAKRRAARQGLGSASGAKATRSAMSGKV